MRLFFLLLMVISVLSCSTKRKDQENRPNIILIMADDLGYGDLSSYGSDEIFTPNIDYLSANGVKFLDFHSNGSVCSPTRAALMTGRYQQRTGVGGVITAKSHREVGMSLKEVTLAEELASNGYHCGMYGKWHLGYAEEFNPIYQGFDEYTGFVSGNIDYHAHIDQEGYLDWWQGNEIINEEGYTTDLISKKSIDFIERNNPKKTGKPFFLYLAHEAPHGPYQRRVDKVVRTIGNPGTSKIEEDSIKSVYKEMVEIMDEGIGLLTTKLKNLGELENTIIVFISDNGANQYGSNGTLRGFKGGVYEGGSRVPAIFHYPGKIPKGSINENIVMTMDLFPTLLDLINIEVKSGRFDGISVKKAILAEEVLKEREIYFEYKNKSYVRRGDWKLIVSSEEGEENIELFDLSKDLEEQENVVKSNSDLLGDLKLSLDNWKKEVNKGVEIVSQ